MSLTTYPTIGSLESRVLARLLKRKFMTHRVFFAIAKTYRLSHMIYMLRQRGWDIETERRKVTTQDPVGRSSSIGIYTLSQDDIDAAGTDGHHYATRVFEWERTRSNDSLWVVADSPPSLITETEHNSTGVTADSEGGA